MFLASPFESFQNRLFGGGPGLVEKFQRELIDGQALQNLSVSDLLLGSL